ncbi:hypothetical protein [Nocardia carnea]|uniref:hypothetical protein n=1 Tax=Nocardia carnea TaxID=37328 RepID=UPI0024546221|nr:hypothetical protein [Nocardia carnea]
MPVVFARVAAVPVSLWLIVLLIADPAYRADNIYAVPDFTFSLLLLTAAFLPTRIAVPAMITGFLFGAGVITIAALDRFDQGQTPQGILNLAIVALYLATAALLIRRISAPRPLAA